MSKKRGDHRSHMDESWLIPYADLLTLLLALFIVLFASSTVNEAKYQAMAEAFGSSLGIFNPATNVVDIENGGFDSNLPPDAPAPPDVDGAGQSQLSNLESTFKTYINNNSLSSQMGVSQLENGVLITLKSDIWFPPGSATITEQQMAIAKQVAAMIAENQKNRESFYVVVSGHTDNTPISTSQFKNNWYLSVARATNFMEALIDSSTLDPYYFSARGLGEYQPVDTNDTPEGRMHNRRVEVFISTAPVK